MSNRQKYTSESIITTIPIKYTMHIFTKSHKNKLKNLTKLPYPDLLRKLITHRKKFPSYDIRQCVSYLKLSTVHQCENLFFLSQFMQGKLRGNGFQLGDHVSNGTVLWYQISKRGMATIYDSVYECRLMDRLTSDQQAHQYTKTFNYIKELSQPLQIPSQNPTTTSSQTILQLLSYGLPQIYNTTHYQPNDHQLFKQEYITMLEKLFKLGGQNFIDSIIEQSNLFPCEFFNITDQPLIKDLFLKYLYRGLGNQVLNSNRDLWLVSRFNLPCGSYILNLLKNLNKQAQNQSQNNSLTNLNIYNNLFTIYRKIGLESESNSNIFGTELKKLVYEIVSKLKLDQLFKNAEDEDSIRNFVKQLEENAVSQALKDQANVINLQNQLYECFGVKGIKLNYNSNKYDLLKFLIKNKILRSLLLTAHLYKQQPSTPKNLQNISIALNSCKDIIQNSITFGDLLPELIYLHDKFSQICGWSIFSQEILEIMRNAKNKYTNVIRQIEKQQDIQILQTKLGDTSYFANRINCPEYLLLSNSRLVLSNTITEFMNRNYSTLSERNIILSLINDVQFLSTFPTNFIKSTIFSYMQKNLQLTCQKQKIHETYPYLPAFNVKSRESSRTSFYFQDNLTHHTRIKSDKDIIINITDQKNIGRIKSMRRLPDKNLFK